MLYMLVAIYLCKIILAVSVYINHGVNDDSV